MTASICNFSTAKIHGREFVNDEITVALRKCSSDGNVAEQQEEIEAITAIYPEKDVLIIRPAPTDISMPSASLSIQLIPKDGNSEFIPRKWIGEISLLIDFPPGYPLDPDSSPKITVDVGNLSMMDFPSSFKKSLTLTVVCAYIFGINMQAITSKAMRMSFYLITILGTTL